MKDKGNPRTQMAEDEFLAGARRAFKRVARRLRIGNGRLGLPLITAENGRVRLIRLNGTKRSIPKRFCQDLHTDPHFHFHVFAKDAAGNYSAAAQVSATPAAIALRAATSANTGSLQATSLTISKPTGVLNGDLLLAGISFQNQGATVTPPSGWTLVRHISAGVGTDVYRKTAGSSEPASYPWSFSSTNKIAGGIIALSSVNLAAPIQGENGTAETVNRTTHTTPTISTTGSSTWLVTVFGDKNNTGSTWTPPSGHTEGVDTDSTGSSAASVEINTKGPVSAGSQSATATASVTSSLAAMEIIAVQP